MPSPLVVVHATLVRPHPERMAIAVETDRTITIDGGIIASIGDVATPVGATVVDAGGRLVTPGLVDAHTHALFLGDRAAEFGARCAGASYLELAKKGGGILATVRATRAGDVAARLTRLRARLKRLVAQGVTTVEVKTGYGLSREHELTQLEELATIAARDLPRVMPTLLAAHALPPEIAPDDRAARERWVRTIADELVPEVGRRRLAGRVDAFVEQAAYTPDEARVIARATHDAGLALHLHVDQLTAGGGAELAAELGAQAAAHLERTTRAGAEALARAGTVGVLLPTATLAAREPGYAPARTLVDAGVRLALATNLNPGTAPTESTSLMLFLASAGLGLTPEESLWAATRGGALALGLDAGRCEVGAPADLVVWNAFAPAHLAYHAAVNHVRLVVRGGEVVCDRSAAADEGCDGVL